MNDNDFEQGYKVLKSFLPYEYLILDDLGKLGR